MFKVLLKKQLAEVFKGYFYDAKRNRMRSKLAVAGWFLFFVVVYFVFEGSFEASLYLAACGAIILTAAIGLFRWLSTEGGRAFAAL